MKRSHAPIFWALFGAGGTLSALLGPMLVFITGIAVPLAWLLPADFMSHARMLAFARHGLGQAGLFAVIVLFTWHAVHRLYKSLHDLGIPPGPASRAACYGSAVVVTVLAVLGVLRLGG